MGGDEVGNVGILCAVMLFQRAADGAIQSTLFSDASKVGGFSTLTCLWDRILRFPLAIGF